MKPSARVANIILFLFFLSFNGLQIYLILERIAETKSRYHAAFSSAQLSTLSEYHKLKSIDSASTPAFGWITYASERVEMTRMDSQSVQLNTRSYPLVTDTVEPVLLEMALNSRTFKSMDLPLFDSIFRKVLAVRKVQADYRLDTIVVPGRRFERQQIPAMWARKRTKGFDNSTSPMRLPYNSNILVFAEFHADPAFTKNDLLWPILAFALILLIGNAALVFIYKTIRSQKRLNEVKTDFINNITHEMKTPITIGLAGLQALEHHVAPTERTNFYLQTSKKQWHLLNEFVERILDAAVQDEPDFTLKREKIDLHGLFRELIASHSILEGKPVKFRLAGEGPVLIVGDRLHLETAFHNIIDNAIKYSGSSVEIEIDIVENTRDCTIKIRDNGVGIPPQFIKNVFEKFFRVPQGDAQSVKGFGLGLYYVSSIVKKHWGTISVQSKPESGTELIITLPKHP